MTTQCPQCGGLRAEAGEMFGGKPCECQFVPAHGSLSAIPHKCPVCDGTGLVSRPPGVAGDVQIWSSMDAAHTCRPCSGSGIIWSKAENDELKNAGPRTPDVRES